MSSTMTAGSGRWTLSRGRVSFFAILLLLDFIIVLVMLATDKNLQSNFGAQPDRMPYFAHWYALLVEGVFDLLVAIGLFVTAARLSRTGGSSVGRGVVMGAVLYTFLALLADLAIVFAYQQVGFPSASQFAQYLFGVTASSGDIRYLYDALLAVYVLTLAVGALALRRVRAPDGSGAAAQP
jgi:hypothetical protein